MSTEILTLPWAIQVALASGYAAYMLAYTGMREHHQGTDIAFRSLVFSLIASAVMAVTQSWHPMASGALAFAATIATGALWRKLGQTLLRSFVRVTDLSWSDDDPSAWATLCCNVRHRVSQIAIQLDDGTWLRCDDTRRFADAPFAPCILGPNGDVALYVTQLDTPSGEERPQSNVRDEFYGDRINYIPASRIRSMTVRYTTRA